MTIFLFPFDDININAQLYEALTEVDVMYIYLSLNFTLPVKRTVYMLYLITLLQTTGHTPERSSYFRKHESVDRFDLKTSLTSFYCFVIIYL